jgi:hypothetical protein
MSREMLQKWNKVAQSDGSTKFSRITESERDVVDQNVGGKTGIKSSADSAK